MGEPALETLLRRDRTIMIAALAALTALAWADLVWLANDMAMGGMDMTGFRVIPAGHGWMMPTDAPWKAFEFGYVFLLAWSVFSLAATAAQWGLDRAALLTPMMESASNALGGILLIAAGLYQW